jgi:hypothetical protein
MAASDNLSSELFNSVPLYRGVQSRDVEKPLGVHWSSNPEVPEKRFARVEPGKLKFDTRKSATIIHGRVNKNAIVDTTKGTGKKMAKEKEIWEPDSWEEEKTVRPGATVQVTGLTRVVGHGTKLKWDENNNAETISGPHVRKRKITYNPPRQVRA